MKLVRAALTALLFGALLTPVSVGLLNPLPAGAISYSSISCSGHYSNLTASQYLNLTPSDAASCAVWGMLQGAGKPLPVWGYDGNVAQEHGKVMVRQSGECSGVWDGGNIDYPDTGPYWDFQVPCKAHDYCYDLRAASFSGTVSDDNCDDALSELADANCAPRNIASRQLCYVESDIISTTVRAPFVVTNPSPGPVEIVNRQTSKCADVEGPSTADVPIQQWSCLGVNQQRWRIYPAPNAAGYFEIRSVYSGKCVAASPFYNVVVQQACSSSGQHDYHRFRIQGALNGNQYSLREGQSGYANCMKVPQTTTNGANLQDPACNDSSNWYLWRIVDA